MESFEINNQAKLIRIFVDQNIDYINAIYQKKPINGPNRFNQAYFNEFLQNAIENYEDGNCDSDLLDAISNIKQSFEELERTVKQRYEEPKLTRFVKKIDILHIEDNELERKTIERYFTNNTVDIKSVETSDEAMYLLNNLTPKVILVDINLKTSNIQGDELCRLIKSNEEYKKVPVILISALVSKIQRHEILEATGADSIIIKPIEKLADLDIIFKYLKDPI
jgi:CheY-like chemotaxis protein